MVLLKKDWWANNALLSNFDQQQLVKGVLLGNILTAESSQHNIRLDDVDCPKYCYSSDCSVKILWIDLSTEPRQIGNLLRTFNSIFHRQYSSFFIFVYKNTNYRTRMRKQTLTWAENPACGDEFIRNLLTFSNKKLLSHNPSGRLLL